MRIAVDAMGGDFAPVNILEGVRTALKTYPQVEKFYLVGDEAQIKTLVDERHMAGNRVEIVHASQVVEMTDSAAASVRRKRDSSISVAVGLVKSGKAQAIVSAGHTGAAVASTTVKLRLIEGVARPGICSPIPNDHGTCNILDAGANPDAKVSHLLQYAIMGTVYARHVLKVENPKVGLMSVGEEEEKGTGFTREVFALLKDSPINFVGNVEGHDLFEKPLDIVLCDGFTGNVVLKSCEATARAIFSWMKVELTKSPIRYMGAMLAKGAFRAVKERGNYETYGGSPLLGVNGICIICHGSSSPLAISNAIRVAASAITHEVNPHIKEEIERYALAHA
jgi:glycerol-3-phosphate acyltransferase PlsX